MINGLVDIEVHWTAEKARKVRPIILGGVFNLAALDPMITSMTMEVSVWVEGKASDLRDKLIRGKPEHRGTGPRRKCNFARPQRGRRYAGASGAADV